MRWLKKQLTVSLVSAYMRKLALIMAGLLGKGRQYHLQYPNDAECGGSVWRKFLAGFYLVLHDYGKGLYPPDRPSHESEMHQVEALTEWRPASVTVERGMLHPFRGHPTPWIRHYLHAFTILLETLDGLGVKTDSRILELGCGMGWMAELLAKRGYDMTGTTIAPVDIENASKRIAANPDLKLKFICSSMEDVTRFVEKNSFDVVFCFEALHHVFDWQKALRSAFDCLKPGGCLLICEEPLSFHTFVCYRSSMIIKTRDIGFGAREIQPHMHSAGFTEITTFKRPKFLPVMTVCHSIIARRIWITARKPVA